MKLSIIIAALSLTAAISQGCMFVSVDSSKIKLGGPSITVDDDAPVVTKEITDFTFDSIQAKGAYDMEYRTGECKVILSAPEAIMEHLLVADGDGVLNIGTDGTNIKNWKNVKAVVYAPSLKRVTISGAVDFEADEITADEYAANGVFSLEINGAAEFEVDRLKASGFEMEVNGAGEIHVKGMDCKDVKAVVNGAGEIELAGKAASTMFEINGAGDIDVRKLDCDNVKFDRRGAATIRR